MNLRFYTKTYGISHHKRKWNIIIYISSSWAFWVIKLPALLIQAQRCMRQKHQRVWPTDKFGKPKVIYKGKMFAYNKRTNAIFWEGMDHPLTYKVAVGDVMSACWGIGVGVVANELGYSSWARSGSIACLKASSNHLQMPWNLPEGSIWYHGCENHDLLFEYNKVNHGISKDLDWHGPVTLAWTDFEPGTVHVYQKDSAFGTSSSFAKPDVVCWGRMSDMCTKLHESVPQSRKFK